MPNQIPSHRRLAAHGFLLVTLSTLAATLNLKDNFAPLRTSPVTALVRTQLASALHHGSPHTKSRA
jgi:hypothetical protein